MPCASSVLSGAVVIGGDAFVVVITTACRILSHRVKEMTTFESWGTPPSLLSRSDEARSMTPDMSMNSTEVNNDSYNKRVAGAHTLQLS